MSNKILIAPTTFCIFDSKPVERLKESGFNIVKNDTGRKLSPEEIVGLGNDCVGVIAGTEMYSKETLEQLSNMKMISRLGVGMDNIDLDSAKECRIKVCRTQTTPAPAVAELALGLILDSFRKISMQHCLMKSGKWQKKMGSLLSGKTLGIIGLGVIGKHLVCLTQGFGLKYLAFDKIKDEKFAQDYAVEYCELEALLSRSNVVSVHLSLSNATKSFIDYEKIKMMKSDAVLVNTSRGSTIDEGGLIKALKENLISCAALDVFEPEPYCGELLDFENVILTPHIGAYAKEIRVKMELESVENLIVGLNKK